MSFFYVFSVIIALLTFYLIYLLVSGRRRKIVVSLSELAQIWLKYNKYLEWMDR